MVVKQQYYEIWYLKTVKYMELLVEQGILLVETSSSKIESNII